MVIVVQQPERAGVVADDGEQRLRFVPGESVALRGVGDEPHRLPKIAQTRGIDRVALNEVVTQHSGGPLAKARGPHGVDPVANGNDDVEVVTVHQIHLAVGRSSCIFCNN